MVSVNAADKPTKIIQRDTVASVRVYVDAPVHSFIRRFHLAQSVNS